MQVGVKLNWQKFLKNIKAIKRTGIFTTGFEPHQMSCAQLTIKKLQFHE